MTDAGQVFAALTRGIRVMVQPTWLAAESEPDKGRFFWRYDVEIRNEGNEPVQLLTRHWIIIDALGRRMEVRGDGVIGEQPRLAPGDSYRYASGTPLETGSGFMQGSYHMITDTGEGFDVEIPAFSLDSPEGHASVN